MWSTTHITESQNAARNRDRGRRGLRIGSLAVSALMTMHCRLSAAALTGDFFFFMFFLIGAVGFLGNPARHFEVYLGQWSISGPGRAFRMIPMLDGIGIAMCINAIVRTISCCTMAAIAALYVINAVSDAELPFKRCRDFNLEKYNPEEKEIKDLRMFKRIEQKYFEPESVTLGLKHKAWRNASYNTRRWFLKRDSSQMFQFPSKVNVCKEKYAGRYPPMYTTPAYNFFYVELVKFREEIVLGQFNIILGVTIIVTWFILWITLIIEKISFGKLLYNNLKQWIIVVPWVWCIVLIAQAASNITWAELLRRVFKLSNRKSTVTAIADAFEVALYIHSVGVGTEIIHGKALNYYASGHIDPNLSAENVWHSAIVLMLAGLHSSGSAMCAIVDYKHFNPNIKSFDMKESTLWIMPMYSKCSSMGNHTHLMTCLIFGGLTFSYMTVAYFLLKAVLHTMFEYKVNLIHWEQLVVAGLFLSCMGLNLVYATNGGIALLESVDAVMNGVALVFVVTMELTCLMYVYRSRDFQSDMLVATEDGACSSRIGIQWKLMPLLTLAVLGMKIPGLLGAEMSPMYMGLAAIPLAAVVLALPMRAVVKALSYVRHKAPTTN